MKMFILFIAIYSAIFSVYGKGFVAPTNIDGATLITTEEAYRLYRSDNNLFVDTRSILEYSEGHIPGAFHIPYISHEKLKKRFNHRKIDSFNVKSVVLYCNGPECINSSEALKIIISHGVKKKIYWYREGLKGWYDQSLPIKEGIFP